MENNDLYHYGVKGQKWGVRRYQNKDGTLTADGKARYRDAVSYGGSMDPERRKIMDEAYRYATNTDEFRNAVSKLKDTAYIRANKYVENVSQDSHEYKIAREEAAARFRKQNPEYKNFSDDEIAGDGNHHFLNEVGEILADKWRSKNGITTNKYDDYDTYRQIIDSSISKIADKTIGESYNYSFAANLEDMMYDNVIFGSDEMNHSDLNVIDYEPDALYHYGIKGMKWGIRRFQNKDGSLTKAGLKRYSDAASDAASKVGNAIAKGGKKLGLAAGKAAQAAKEKIAENHAQRKEEKRIEKLMSKPIRKLTEEERIERMDRKMKEKELLSLEKNVKDLKDSSMSKGRKFVEDMVTKVAIPSVLNAGEKQLTAFLNKKLGDAFGLGEKDTNLLQEVLSGDKQLKDLTDGQINKLGKASESWGNFTKNVLGKNSDQNNEDNDGSTVFKDFMSGKLKTSEATDGQLSKGKKSAEAADALEKLKKKQQPESETTDTNTNKNLRNKPISEMSDIELKDYKNRIDLEESVNKLNEKRHKEEIDRGRIWVEEEEDLDYGF